MVCEEPGVYRVLGTQVERLVVQTDWDNEEALIYLQHRFARMGVDDALEKAGCRPGDEVRIVGRAFTFEGAEEYLDEVAPDESLAADDATPAGEDALGDAADGMLGHEDAAGPASA